MICEKVSVSVPVLGFSESLGFPFFFLMKIYPTNYEILEGGTL